MVVEPATPGKAGRRSGRRGRSVAQAEEEEDLGEGEADAGGGDSGAAPARLLPRHDSAGAGCGDGEVEQRLPTAHRVVWGAAHRRRAAAGAQGAASGTGTPIIAVQAAGEASTTWCLARANVARSSVQATNHSTRPRADARARDPAPLGRALRPVRL